jgi:hypothetical protein
MKTVWRVAPALLLLTATLTVLAAWTQSAPAVARARPGLVAAAAVAYSVGFVVFASTWASLVVAGGAAAPGGREDGAGFLRAVLVGLLSLAGLLTPMNVGTDVLRSTLGRRYLGAPVVLTAAASIATREWKLRVMLALVPAAAAWGLGRTGEWRPLLVAVAGAVGVVVALAAFRSGPTSRLARALGIGGLAEATRSLHRQVPRAGKALVYGLFAGGFAAEWGALHLSLAALGLQPGPAVTVPAYGMLFFLSRTPVIPLGIGLVETAGVAWLRLAGLPLAQAGAAMLLWSGLRVSVPHLLSAIAFFGLPGWHGRRAPVSRLR